MKTLNAAKLLSVLAVLLCNWSAQAKDLQTVRIGLTSNSFANAPVLLAKSMGFYEKHNLDPIITIAESGAVAMSALISGSFDAVNISTSELIAINTRGQRVVALSNLYSGLAGTLILSKAAVERLGVAANAPVAQRLKALDGLKIATPSAASAFTSSYFGAARAAGAKPVPVYLAQTAMVSALQTGAVDAFIASAPFWAPPVLSGVGVVWISGPRGELGSGQTLSSAAAILMTLKAAQANPELAKTLVRVQQDFKDALKTRPDDVKAALLTLYPTLDKKSLEVMYDAESIAWNPPPFTKETMLHDIALLKATGDLPDVEKLDPASLLFP